MEKISLDELLRKDLRGKTICFPTDTVYGLAALYDDEEAINKIYQVKHRDSSKPLAILIANKDISPYVLEIPALAKNYLNQWPGALTLIFKKSSLIPDYLTKGLQTVAFRMPDSDIALKIINKFGPLATTSVNLSGEAELNNIDDIYNQFFGKIDYLVSDQAKLSFQPSKIIDLSAEEIKYLRH